MYDVHDVTNLMYRLGVGKIIKNIINSLQKVRYFGTLMKSGIPGWVTGAAADVQGKDSKKCHVHRTLNPSFVADNRVGSR